MGTLNLCNTTREGRQAFVQPRSVCGAEGYQSWTTTDTTYENATMGCSARPSLYRSHWWGASLVLVAVGSEYGTAAAQPAPEPVTCESDPLCNNRVERAELSAREGNLKGAVLLYKLAYSERPDPRLLYQLGSLYQKQGQRTEAKGAYKEFLSKPGQDEASRRRALAFLLATEKVDSGPDPALPAESLVKPQQDKALRITGGTFLGLGALQAVVGGTMIAFPRGGASSVDGAAAVLGNGVVSVLIGVPILVVGLLPGQRARPTPAAPALPAGESEYRVAAAQPAQESVECEEDAMCRHRLHRIEAYLREGNIQRAVDLYKLAYSERPDPQLLFRLARLHQDRGQLVEAADAYKAFLEKPGRDEEQRRQASVNTQNRPVIDT